MAKSCCAAGKPRAEQNGFDGSSYFHWIEAGVPNCPPNMSFRALSKGLPAEKITLINLL
jgi:hypothetical protein